MCFKAPKPDPRIAEQQAKQEAEVAAQKAKELEAAEIAREKEAAAKKERQLQEKQRDADLRAKGERQLQEDVKGMVGRSSKRGGTGRRSLLSSAGGGEGFFSRFQ